MKISYIEICGFRGFRDKIRIDFGKGFTIINGRNGVGKSTLCDAIEFAICGEIHKYSVEKSANENLVDYIWWRGKGTAEAHYVTAEFVDDNGNSTVISRTRENGANLPTEQIEQAFCIANAKPLDALIQLCKTSIIRDELIATLSLDLTERERFELVRSALGAIEGPDYTSKAEEVLKGAKAILETYESQYEETRNRLNITLTELTEMRDLASNAADISEALITIESELSESGNDLSQKIIDARSQLTLRRMHLNAMSRAIAEAREIALWRIEIEAPTFQEKKSELVQLVSELKMKQIQALSDLEEAHKRLALIEEADVLANALTSLVEHGEHVGLQDGHCPLCNTVLSNEEFAKGLSVAKSKLSSQSNDISYARQNVAEKDRVLQSLEAELADAQHLLSQHTSREKTVGDREAAHVDFFMQHDLDLSLVNKPDELEKQLLNERSKLVNLEKAILTLEASQSIERVTELEATIAALHKELDDISTRVSTAQKAVNSAKNMDKAVRRANAELIDERLAMISPLLNELYQRLRPHSDWRNIEYNIRGDVKRFLSLKVGDNLNPQFVFSSGQRRAAGLAFLLSVHLARPWCHWKTLILDDPVQHIDDFRALHLVELLSALRYDDRQIICAVEDSSLADLLCRRLLSTSDSPGRRFDLDISQNGSAILTKMTDYTEMNPKIFQESSQLLKA